MIEIRADIRGGEAVSRDLGRVAQDVAWAVDRKLARAAQEAAREMRRAAPKATSVLTNSIRAERVGELEHRAVAGVAYAAYVEGGSGPGGRPPFAAMLRWVRVKRLAPHNPGMDERDLAWAIARAIARRGTPPQPFAAPVAADPAFRVRVQALVDEGVADGLRAGGH